MARLLVPLHVVMSTMPNCCLCGNECDKTRNVLNLYRPACTGCNSFCYSHKNSGGWRGRPFVAADLAELVAVRTRQVSGDMTCELCECLEDGNRMFATSRVTPAAVVCGACREVCRPLPTVGSLDKAVVRNILTTRARLGASEAWVPDDPVPPPRIRPSPRSWGLVPVQLLLDLPAEILAVVLDFATWAGRLSLLVVDRVEGAANPAALAACCTLRAAVFDHIVDDVLNAFDPGLPEGITFLAAVAALVRDSCGECGHRDGLVFAGSSGLSICQPCTLLAHQASGGSIEDHHVARAGRDGVTLQATEYDYLDQYAAVPIGNGQFTSVKSSSAAITRVVGAKKAGVGL